MKQNPNLVQQLQTADTEGVVNKEILSKTTPDNDMLKEVWYKQRSMEIDRQVADIKSKYGVEIDEVALFNKANELRTEDLDFVYRAMSFDNKKTDESALIERAKAELRAELENQTKATSTIVTPTKPNTVPNVVAQLTEKEKRVAVGMGMSEADYAKWKSH